MAEHLIVETASKLSGEIHIPGDKSISHRAVILGALARGETKAHNFLNSEDCLTTIDCFRKMGVQITVNGPQLTIIGSGLDGLKKPKEQLFVGNSGTTIRLLSGILAGQDFESTITGDKSIEKRPMKRIADPLKQMGANISGRQEGKEIYPPLKITGADLKGVQYKMPIASAQVKSCLMLAGLFAEGDTSVIEPAPSRDHTERMLAYFGVPVKKFKNEITVSPPEPFEGREIFVPGDISSAAYFLVAGLLVPNSNITLREIGTNPTRTGILEVLHRMGANVEVGDEELMSGEPRANLKLQTSKGKIKGIEIGGELIPRLIDEIPVIAVLATQAEGKTIIKEAKELRVKESDRIKTMSEELNKMGAKITPTEDGMVIEGPTKLKGATVKSYGDHRVAMSLVVAGLIAEGKTTVKDTDCIATSFPGYYNLILRLSK